MAGGIRPYTSVSNAARSNGARRSRQAATSPTAGSSPRAPSTGGVACGPAASRATGSSTAQADAPPTTATSVTAAKILTTTSSARRSFMPPTIARPSTPRQCAGGMNAMRPRGEDARSPPA
jgi:hypothetical protein